MTKPEITNAALSLSHAERAELALILLRSLHGHDSSPNREIELAWDRELADRLSAIESGEAELQPAGDMFVDLRSRLALSK